MSSRFFKQRLATIKKLDAMRARLMLTGTSQTPKVSMYAINPTNDSLVAMSSPVLDSYVRNAAFSPDGKFLVTTSGNAPYATLYRFDPATQQYVKVTDSSLPSYVTASAGEKAISFTADGKLLCISHASKPFLIFERSIDETTYRILHLPNGTVGADVSAISPDGNTVAVQNSDDRVYIYIRTDPTTWTYTTWYDFAFSSGEITCMKWMPDNATLFVATNNASNALNAFKWNGTKLSKVATQSSGQSVRHMDINLSVNHIAISGGTSASPTCAIYRWNAATNTFSLVRNITFPDVVNGVAFSPDGVYMAIGHALYIANSVRLKLYRRLGESYTEFAHSYPADNSSSGVRPYFSPVV